jgi:hypothetical protein
MVLSPPIGFNLDPSISNRCGDHCVHYNKWYCGLALFSELGCAKLTGITA